MSEYIITDEQLRTAAEAYSERELSLPITEVFISGDKLTEIVRCRDCKYYHDGTTNGRRYAEPHCLAIGELAYGALFEVDEDCFCSWGERKEVDA